MRWYPPDGGREAWIAFLGEPATVPAVGPAGLFLATGLVVLVSDRRGRGTQVDAAGEELYITT